jgi:polysaccharide export outer membrane protein
MGEIILRALLPKRALVRFVALACVVSMAVGCSTTLRPPPESGFPAYYRVGSPDQLRITVLPDPPLERQERVRPDGRISIDLIGDVDAAGRTTQEIAADIEERIARYKLDPRVTVSVAMSLTDSITIFGEVRSPGAFPLERETRLAEAIGLRGGPTPFARRGKVRVIRVVEEETEVIMANLAAIQIVVVPANVLAQIGYLIQNITFPFTTIFSPASAGMAMSGRF